MGRGSKVIFPIQSRDKPQWEAQITLIPIQEYIIYVGH